MSNRIPGDAGAAVKALRIMLGDQATHLKLVMIVSAPAIYKTAQ